MQNKKLNKTIILYNATNNVYMLVTTINKQQTSNTIFVSNSLQAIKSIHCKNYTTIQQYNNLYYTQNKLMQVNTQQAQQIINSCNLYN